MGNQRCSHVLSESSLCFKRLTAKVPNTEGRKLHEARPGERPDGKLHISMHSMDDAPCMDDASYGLCPGRVQYLQLRT